MSSCGLGSADVEDFDPAGYYTADYFSGKHSDGYADYLGAERVLRREFAQTVKFMRRFRGAGRLLDIGCAYGFFLKEARRFFEIAGIEIAEEAAEACRRAGLPVLSGMADEATMAKVGVVDVIPLIDVIEHLAQPDETLALCQRQLTPGGLILITTGDCSFAARLSGAMEVDDTPASMVLHARELAPHGRKTRSLDHTCRSCGENRPAFPHRISVASHAGPT